MGQNSALVDDHIPFRRKIVIRIFHNFFDSLSPCYTFTILATIHHNLSRCDYTIISGWIKQKFRNHYNVSQCSYGVSTNQLRFIVVLLR